MKSFFKFLFPIPSIIVLFVMGFLLCFAESNGKEIIFSDWISLMLFFFVVYIIPFDIVWWIFKRILNFTKNKFVNSCSSNIESKFDEVSKDNFNTNTSLTEATIPNSKYSSTDSFSNLSAECNENSSFPEDSILKPMVVKESNKCFVKTTEPPHNSFAQYDIERYAVMCNAHLEHQDEMEQYNFNTTPETENTKKDALAPIENASYDELDGYAFEQFCADLLRKNDFENVSVTTGSKDQGIDILAFKGGVKYGIQCKCYFSDIGNKAVQEAFSGSKYYDCHVPVVLTNRYFTQSAKELATKINVLLWDRTSLEKFIAQSK